MESLSSVVITMLATLTAIGQFISILLIVLFLILKFKPKHKFSKRITKYIDEYYVVGILIVSAIATIGSLTFSEILGFIPCKLCWYQRIFMYPQFIIAGIALLTNDKNIRKYIISLSIVGFVIAVYHVLVQFFPQALECSDEVAKCSAKEFATFGYITIPVMSATAFLMIILFSLVKKNK